MSNIYDTERFFNKYKNMPRSKYGLSAAGEWHQLKPLLGDLSGKKILDIGCGFGWHCKYASDNNAENIIGIDISKKMLDIAKRENSAYNIQYLNMSMNEMRFSNNSFDLIFSSLAIHYIEDYQSLVDKMYNMLKKEGSIVISVEHPSFTAEGSQEWIYCICQLK